MLFSILADVIAIPSRAVSLFSVYSEILPVETHADKTENELIGIILVGGGKSILGYRFLPEKSLYNQELTFGLPRRKAHGGAAGRERVILLDSPGSAAIRVDASSPLFFESGRGSAGLF